jgi:1-acyl-sn-glycerol-3-phosphate acyltransferase
LSYLPSHPVPLAESLLSLLGTQVSVRYQERIPASGPVLLVSNHRSFLDAPLLMTAMGRQIRFACHHYMGQVPGLRELVTALGCFPLDEPQRRSRSFFKQATQFLQQGDVVGIFPEGTPSMVRLHPSDHLWHFQQGFAHLAARLDVPGFAILPVAIAPIAESLLPSMPMLPFRWLDPQEPLFAESDWHPMVMYQDVRVLFDQPLWLVQGQITAKIARGSCKRSHWIKALSSSCQQEIQLLLHQGLS